MAQTVNGKTVSFIRSRAPSIEPADVIIAELDHVTKIDAEIVAMAAANPTHSQSSIVRNPHGEYELLTLLVWL